MLTRLLLLTAGLTLACVYLSGKAGPEPVVARTSFVEFPQTIGPWSSIPTEPFSANVLAVLGVDEHVNRYYKSGDGLAHLYIGYYKTQREGDAIHSPMNCLPGAGWLPISRASIDLHPGGVPIHVNRFLIEKGLDKQLVVYWYQSHGRTIASDYWSKIYLVLDSMRVNRTDAALVRVIVPFGDSATASEPLAEHAAVSLVDAIYPLLARYLPS